LQAVETLQRVLQAAGIRVWRDTDALWPGQDWRSEIRGAIIDGALVFIACFAGNSNSRAKSYQNEDFTLAIEQLRQRQSDDSWLIPVGLGNCEIPGRDIGGGRTLGSIQRVDLFGDREWEGIARLVAAVLRILNRGSAAGKAVQVKPVSIADPGPRYGVVTAGHDTGAQSAGAVSPAERTRERSAADGSEQRSPGPAIAGRWRLTHPDADVPALTLPGNERFHHRAYGRPKRLRRGTDPGGGRLRRARRNSRLAGTAGQVRRTAHPRIRQRPDLAADRYSRRGSLAAPRDVPPGVAGSRSDRSRRVRGPCRFGAARPARKTSPRWLSARLRPAHLAH